MNEWQPIETAPKDGERIIAWWPIGKVIIAHYERGGWESDAMWERRNLLIPDLTNWMPLPKPPK